MSTPDSPAPEVTSHAGALTYTAAMSAAAADTVTSLERTLAAMRRGSVHSDALAHLADAADDARHLSAALADAHQSLTRHDTVREAYAAAGDAGDKDWMTSDVGSTAALQVADAGTPAAGTPTGPPVPDVFGISDVDEKYHGTDTVSGTGDTNANLALYCSPSLPGLALIEVNTSPGQWHPTNADKRSTIDPLVSPREARKLATLLDDLVTLGRSGARVSRPTRLQKTAEKLSELLGTDPDACLSVVGDGGEDEISARDLQRLLALVPKPDVDGRCRLPCKDAGNEMQSDDGTVHAELLTPAGGTPTITVSAVEGNEPPDKTATARLNLDGAAELAGKLRCFADAADAIRAGAWIPPNLRDDFGDDALFLEQPMPSPAEPATAAEPAPVQVRTSTGDLTEIGSDGAVWKWSGEARSQLPAGSADEIGVRLVHQRAAIQAGHGDRHTEDDARQLLAGLNADELGIVARDLGVEVSPELRRSRTKLAERIVHMAVTAPKKYYGLRHW